MKSYKLTFLAAALLIIVATGCQKDDFETFAGSYTYKTSGMVGLLPTAYIGTGVPLDTTWVALVPEQGQMHIVKENNSEKMIVTWNDITGNACSTGALISGKNIAIESNTKTAQLTNGQSTVGSGIVQYAGVGELFDNVLIIDLQYTGVFTVSNTAMTAVASKVECIATAN